MRLMLTASCLLLLVAFVAGARAASGAVTFVREYVDGQNGVSGLQNNDDITVSSDGANVYTAAQLGVATFKRQADGKLKFVNLKSVDGVENVVASPDGRNVYVTDTGDGVLVYKRDQDSGKLSTLQKVKNGRHGVKGMSDAWAIAASPDGKNVYVTSDGNTDSGVLTFKRDKHSGKLKFVNDRPDGGSGGDFLANASGVTVSPDGKSVYATGQNDNAVVTFKRNHKTGSLKLVNSKVDGTAGVSGLGGAYEPTVSGDGRNVYVSGSQANAIATFKRDKHSGKLTFVDAKVDSAGEPIPDPLDEVVSADGKNVYVAGYDQGNSSGLVTFKRDPETGKLTWKGILRDGVGGVTVDGLWRVAISPDDRSIYTADYDAGGLSLFKRSK